MLNNLLNYHVPGSNLPYYTLNKFYRPPIMTGSLWQDEGQEEKQQEDELKEGSM